MTQANRHQSTTRTAGVLSERFLNRKEAAELLGLAVSTLAVWQSQGSKSAVPMRKHGNRAMYAVSDLLDWSERRRA